MSKISDADKLRLLADWFDRRDARADVFNSEVQRDLRRIADEVDRYKEYYYEFLSLRGVEKDSICPECQGLGVKTYASTATWRGGLGGAMITQDVCDHCWGSGSTRVTWVNLRKIGE